MDRLTDRPWIAGHDVGVELARELVERAFPALAPARLDAFGIGWDNTVFLVNDAWVFRFPRRRIAVDLLDAENAVLPAIAARLPLPIPVPAMIARDADPRFPWPFAGYRMLPGHTADRAALDAGRRAAWAAPLARFLAALHAQSASAAPPDGLRRLDVAHRAPRLERRLRDAVAGGWLETAAPWCALLEDTPRDYDPDTTTLVHGDLHAANLLADGDGRPAGVIDWGDVHRGDAAVDLSIAHGFLPPAAHAVFRAAYGPIDDAAWRMARFKALQTAVALLAYGHDTGNEPLEREARVSLSFLAAAGGR